METTMPVVKVTAPDIAETLDVSVGRVRRAIKALELSTARGTLFTEIEVKRIAKQVAAFSAARSR
jgi:hypothetical protein